jgi:surface protein
MAYMFSRAYMFNQSLKTFNVSKVTNMTSMFSNAFVFNKPIDSWDVSKVTSMSGMFYSAYAFNQYLGSWNVGNVIDFQNMFYAASSFNQSFLTIWDFTKASTAYWNDLLSRYPSGIYSTSNNVFIYPTTFNGMLTSSGLSPEVCYSVLTGFFNRPAFSSNFNWGLNLGSVPMFSQPLLYTDRYVLWGTKPSNYNGDWNFNQSMALRDNVLKSYYNNPNLIVFRQANWSINYVNTLKNQSFYITITDPYNPRSTINVSVNIPEFNLSQFISAGYSVSRLLDGGYTLSQMIATGYPINSLLTTDGYQLSDLSNVAITKTVLTQSQITINQLFTAGFSITKLITNGFQLTDLSSCAFTKVQWQTAGYVPLQLFNAGFSITTFFTDGFQLTDLSSCPFTKSQWTAQNIIPSDLQGAGFSIPTLIHNGYQLQDLTQTTYTGAQWIAAGYTVRQLFDAGFTIIQMVSLGLPVPTFSFRILGSVFDQSGGIYPVLNAHNSFTGYHVSTGNMGPTRIITIYWAYYANLSPEDGLNFSATPYYNEPSINITNFGGVPLALMTGTSNAAFYRFAGQITAPDVPSIPNHSLNSCFYGGSCSNFGNINGWDISGVTDLTAAFENCTNFNSSLDKWSTQSVTSMRALFSGCSSFTQDISTWNLTSVIPSISQGSMYNFINGTAIDPARTSNILLKVINSYNEGSP